MERNLLSRAMDADERRVMHVTPASVFAAMRAIEENTGKDLLFTMLDDEGMERTLTIKEWRILLSMDEATEETAEDETFAGRVELNPMLPIAGRTAPIPTDEEEDEEGESIRLVYDEDHLWNARDVMEMME